MSRMSRTDAKNPPYVAHISIVNLFREADREISPIDDARAAAKRIIEEVYGEDSRRAQTDLSA